MVDLLDLFRSDYAHRKREKEAVREGGKRERKADVWFLISANKQPPLAL